MLIKIKQQLFNNHWEYNVNNYGNSDLSGDSFGYR